MLTPQHWKLVSAAVVLGGLTISLLPRDPAVTVREVVTGQQTAGVVLSGSVEVLRPNRFLLRDGTGEIRLETCPPWYRPLPLHPGEHVRVQGTLAPRHHWRMDHPVFVVHSLHRENGEEIVLRHGYGLPPWRHETWRTRLAAYH